LFVQNHPEGKKRLKSPSKKDKNHDAGSVDATPELARNHQFIALSCLNHLVLFLHNAFCFCCKFEYSISQRKVKKIGLSRMIQLHFLGQ